MRNKIDGSEGEDEQAGSVDLQELEEEIALCLQRAQSRILGTLCEISFSHPVRAAFLGEQLSEAFRRILTLLVHEPRPPHVGQPIAGAHAVPLGLEQAPMMLESVLTPLMEAMKQQSAGREQEHRTQELVAIGTFGGNRQDRLGKHLSERASQLLSARLEQIGAAAEPEPEGEDAA